MNQKPKKVILIADDDPNVRKLVKFSIQHPDFDIITVANGRDALEEAGRRPIDLAIIDALMPGMHGFEVARRLRDVTSNPNVKIVMLTSIYRQRQYELEARAKYGVDHYLLKPFHPEELKAKVLEILDMTES